MSKNQKLLIGYNDFATINSKLASEWHITRNGNLRPEDFISGSNKKIWWQCEKGHVWKATILSRTKRGNGCSICSNHQVLTGYNDLAITNPKLAKAWHPTKNGTLMATDVTAGKNIKVWWQCEKGHEWEAIINNRNRKHYGCPICSNQKLLIGYNDLATTNPKLGSEWHTIKNEDLKSTDVFAGSHKKVWWKCKAGHEWEASIANRSKGHGCAVCSNYLLVVGCNDLATINPKVADEWHPIKNGNLKQTDVVSGSTKKVWWKCENGHEWEAIISSRNRGNGCPHCAGEKYTSFNEQAILFYMTQMFDNVCSRQKINGYEVDIFIKDVNVAIEYDSMHWHSNERSTEKRKNSALQEFLFIRVREIGLPELNAHGCHEIFVPDNEKGIKEAMLKILTIFKINKIVYKPVEICLEKDRIDIYNNMNILDKTNSLESLNPKLAKEWDSSKNGDLKPTQVTSHSGKKVWWQCEKGHEWVASVDNRSKGRGCPYCGNKKVLESYNDLVTINPKLAEEWHPIKNEDLKPTEVVFGSNKKVWWSCTNGHEWQATIVLRNSGGFKCPYCK